MLHSSSIKLTVFIRDAIGLGAIVFYTIDYILNLATAPSGLWFAFKGFMITDFLATFPFYVELILDYFNIMEVISESFSSKLIPSFRLVVRDLQHFVLSDSCACLESFPCSATVLSQGYYLYFFSSD